MILYRSILQKEYDSILELNKVENNTLIGLFELYSMRFQVGALWSPDLDNWELRLYNEAHGRLMVTYEFEPENVPMIVQRTQYWEVVEEMIGDIRIIRPPGGWR